MTQQINLFNPIFLKQKKYFSAVTMLQALGLILLGCLLMVAYADIQLSKRRTEAAETAAQLIKTRDQLITVTTQFAPKKNTESLDDEIKKTQADLKSMQTVLDMLHSSEFGDTKGYSSYFRSFSRQIVDGLWLTGIGIVGAGHDIDLHGRTINPELIPLYLTHLRRESDMQGKSFSELDIQAHNADAVTAAESKPAKPALPRYIEFNLQSSVASDASQGGKSK